MFTEVMRESEDGKTITLTTPSATAAFQMAETMAFGGYSVKLGKEPGAPWVVVATTTAGVNQHANV